MKWSPEQIKRLNAYVDRPWRAGCWDWVRFVRREFYNLDTPLFAYDPRNSAANSHIIAKCEADETFCGEHPRPEDGDVVSMGHGDYGLHVGVYADLDRGVVLHVERGREVRADPVARLAWTRIKFFRLKDAA